MLRPQGGSINYLDTTGSSPIAFTTSADVMYSAGRDPANTFKDVRSASKPRRRSKAQRKKYYNFDIVKPGQLAAPHYQAPNSSFNWPVFPADLAECDVVHLDRKQLFKEAKQTGPSYLGPGCSCCVDWMRKAYAKEKKAVKHEAFDWDKRWSRREFAGQIEHDHRNYDELAAMDAEDMMSFEWSRWNWTPDIASDRHVCSPECDWCDTYQPTEAYDLETMVNNALAGLRAPVLEIGWEDLAGDVWSSPEMEWANETMELFEDDEDFELV